MSSSSYSHAGNTHTLWLSSQGLPLDSRPTHPAALDASLGHHKLLALNISKVGLIIFLISGRCLLPTMSFIPRTSLQDSCVLSSGFSAEADEDEDDGDGDDDDVIIRGSNF